MRYVSIDIETTGLNPDKHQILQIGAIVEDTNNPLPFEELPKFNVIIRHRDIEGEMPALAMNVGLLQRIANNTPGPGEVVVDGDSFLGKPAVQFWQFCDDNKVFDDKNRLTLAGKNLGQFDLLFLTRLAGWKPYFMNFRIHCIDPAILFLNWDDDTSVPGLGKCKQRAGLSGEVAHDAIADAWDVIQLLRTQYVPVVHFADVQQ